MPSCILFKKKTKNPFLWMVINLIIEIVSKACKLRPYIACSSMNAAFISGSLSPRLIAVDEPMNSAIHLAAVPFVD